MKKMIISLLVAILMVFGLTISANAISFTDGTFNDTNWTLTIQPLINGGTVNASQYTSGGNPGDYRRIVNIVSAGDGSGNSSGFWGFHINTVATYDPTTHGAMSSIDYSEDSIMFAGSGDGQGTGPALLQGVKLYYSYDYFSGLYFANTSTWTTKTFLSLAALDFRTLSDPNDNPDFSGSGSPITFGFFRANTTRGGGYSIDAGIDNWSVSTNPAPIPEPATIFLLGSGLVGLAGFRKKFRKK